MDNVFKAHDPRFDLFEAMHHIRKENGSFMDPCFWNNVDRLHITGFFATGYNCEFRDEFVELLSTTLQIDKNDIVSFLEMKLNQLCPMTINSHKRKVNSDG